MTQRARVRAETLVPPFAELGMLRVLERRRFEARCARPQPFAQIQSRIWAFCFWQYVTIVILRRAPFSPTKDLKVRRRRA